MPATISNPIDKLELLCDLWNFYAQSKRNSLESAMAFADMDRVISRLSKRLEIAAKRDDEMAMLKFDPAKLNLEKIEDAILRKKGEAHVLRRQSPS